MALLLWSTVYRVKVCLFMFVFYLFIDNYPFCFTVQLISTSTATFEGFMVEARNSTEYFDIGSTIWGTWITDPNLLGSGYDPNMNLLYHTVECNRSLTSSEGSFDVRYYIAHCSALLKMGWYITSLGHYTFLVTKTSP